MTSPVHKAFRLIQDESGAVRGIEGFPPEMQIHSIQVFRIDPDNPVPRVAIVVSGISIDGLKVLVGDAEVRAAP